MFKVKDFNYTGTPFCHTVRSFNNSPKFWHFKTSSRNHPVDLQRIWYGKIACLSQWKQGLFHFLLIDLVKLIIQLSLLLRSTKRRQPKRGRANEMQISIQWNKSQIQRCLIGNTPYENLRFCTWKFKGPLPKRRFRTWKPLFLGSMLVSGELLEMICGDLDGVVSDTRVFIKESEHPRKGNR